MQVQEIQCRCRRRFSAVQEREGSAGPRPLLVPFLLRTYLSESHSQAGSTSRTYNAGAGEGSLQCRRERVLRLWLQLHLPAAASESLPQVCSVCTFHPFVQIKMSKPWIMDGVTLSLRFSVAAPTQLGERGKKANKC